MRTIAIAKSANRRGVARWLIIAVPGDRRLAAFSAALARAGAEAPVVVPWLAVIADPACVAEAVRPDDIVRIESPGSDPTTWHALARLGGAPAELVVPAGTWRPGRWWAAGLRLALDGIARVLAALPVMWGNDPGELRTMSDKRACRQALAAAGVPIPAGLDEVPRDPGELRSALVGQRWSRVFVKPRWGSSGAGVIAWARSAHAVDAQERVTTTLLPVDGQLTNTKRLRVYHDRATIDRLLAAVLADGAVVERWLPKIGVAGGPLDVRQLVIAGQACHAVARVGRGPITNLHLDASRLAMEELLALAPEGLADDLGRLARAVAAVFPASTYFGLDVLLDQAWRPWVIEVNGWGDHLPRLLHHGLDTCAAEIAALDGRMPMTCAGRR